MKWIAIFILSICGIIAESSPCSSLKGYWYNQHGSELLLNNDTDNEVLTGEYRTMVERKTGSAGDTYALIRGLVSQGRSASVLGFSSVFNGGQSVSSWLGQCMTCNNITELRTIWLLKKMTDTCGDEWKSTLIGEDIFTREVVNGPKKQNGIHTPKRASNEEHGTVVKNSNSGHPHSEKSTHLEGKWYTTNGQILELFVKKETGEISGKFIDSIKSNHEGKVIGSVVPTSRNAVFGCSIVAVGSKSSIVLVGQYHICGEREILETSWLQTKEQQSCSLNEQGPRFRKMRFTRTASVKSETISKPKISTMFSQFSDSVSNFFSNLFGRKNV